MSTEGKKPAMSEDLRILNDKAVSILQNPLVPSDIRFAIAAAQRLLNTLCTEYQQRHEAMKNG